MTTAGLQTQTGPSLEIKRVAVSVQHSKDIDNCLQLDAAIPASVYLSSYAYLGEVGGGAVILDLRSGNYLGIDEQHLNGLRARIRNWPGSRRGEQSVELQPDATVESSISDLLRRGILTLTATHPQKTYTQECLGALTLQGDTITLNRVSLRHVAQFLLALLAVTLTYPHGMRRLLVWLRRRQSEINRARGTAAIRSTAEKLTSFMKLRILCYTARRRCLFDSLVLSVFLTREVIPCTFVIGVSTKPFRAHSWVQIGELVLNDTAEHVQQFKPILAIGEGQ
jgi:hypothetical protein